MNKTGLYLTLALGLSFLSACNSNDDVLNDNFNGEITIDGDVECCSVEEARLVYNFVKTVREMPVFSDTIDGTYRLHAYTSGGSLHVGYNDLWVVVTKLKNANYVKEFTLQSITPLMTMQMASGMTMQHSAPTGGDAEGVTDQPSALKHTWVSFLMAAEGDDKWELSYSLSVQGGETHMITKAVNVAALPEGQSWLKSFKDESGDTYFLSLVSPDKWQTGSNDIRAYVSRKSTPATDPYPVADRVFTIDIDPRMPDMGGHTSPDNEALTLQDDDSYLGKINLTMTGLWRIYLTVKDEDGNLVAGGDNTLYWDVTL